MPKQPANVTPAVIYKTYGVKEPKVSRSDKNRQAVAEFQVRDSSTQVFLL